MKWFGMRVMRHNWKTPSVIMVGGATRKTAEEMLGDAGYLVLPGKLDILPLVNGTSVKMVLLGAPTNPPVNPKKAIDAYKCISHGCTNRLTEDAVQAGYQLCVPCHEKFLAQERAEREPPPRVWGGVPRVVTRCEKCLCRLSVARMISRTTRCRKCEVNHMMGKQCAKV